jgi:hypothetical protein
VDLFPAFPAFPACLQNIRLNPHRRRHLRRRLIARHRSRMTNRITQARPATTADPVTVTVMAMASRAEEGQRIRAKVGGATSKAQMAHGQAVVAATAKAG